MSRHHPIEPEETVDSVQSTLAQQKAAFDKRTIVAGSMAQTVVLLQGAATFAFAKLGRRAQFMLPCQTETRSRALTR